MGWATDASTDVEHALQRLVRAGGDRDETRRAFKGVLSELYALREHRRKQLPPGQYFEIAAKEQAGRTTEAICAVRSIAVHHLERVVQLKLAPIYPGPDLFPSRMIFPGKNLTWAGLEGLTPDERAEIESSTNGKYYAGHLAGRLVLPSLDTARWYLTEAGCFQPLDSTHD